MPPRILVVAPHPDDEILGCGGTLLRRRKEGADIAWLIVTVISEQLGWSAGAVRQRALDIDRVTNLVGFGKVYQLQFPAARLDSLPRADLIEKLSDVFQSFQPDEVLVPHPSDAHSDHRVVFDAVSACTKWFRYPTVKRVLAYETISETGFGLDPGHVFSPNVFVDIGEFLDRKLDIMAVYKSEIGAFPFPRSLESIRALAILRGSHGGFSAAEAFQLLRERQ